MMKWLRRIALSLLVGVLAGLASAAFLYSLNAVTQYRLQHSELILFLPLGATAIVYGYERWAGRASRGVGLILQEIHSPQQRLPLRMAPMVLIGTVLTHLFGGSAGREGTAVQMGASLADQFSRFFQLNPQERKSLLAAGMGAGFAGAIGAPWAGVLFGLEVVHVGRLKWAAWLECLLAAWVSYGVTRLLPTPHTAYFQSVSLEWGAWLMNPSLWLLVVLLAAISGGAASLFSRGTHGLASLWLRWMPVAWLRAGVVGAFILVIYSALGTLRYAGLGIEVIQQALAGQVPLTDPLWKGLLTAMTLSAGLKGGEFIPLVFIGTTLGRILVTVASPFLIPWGISVVGLSEVLPVVGFAAVFAAASNTPWACSVMAIELFGWQWGPFVFLGTRLAYHLSGQHGIYPFQKDANGKWLAGNWHRIVAILRK